MVPTTDPVITAVPGKPNLLLGAYDLATVGYRADEYFIAGTASSYALGQSPGRSALPLASGRAVPPARRGDYLSSFDIRRSASTLPPVWQVGQY